MKTLGEELIRHTDDIVERWYQTWLQSPHRHPEISETALKDHLPQQLRLIGQQLRELGEAEDPQRMWRVTDRLDPEARVEQDMPIEETVQEYGLAVDVVRDWIEERGIDVGFRELSYFYAAVFELTAEAVRRYARHQAERVREDRSRHLAGVMHQLRTPLSALAVQVEVLEHTGGGPDDAAVARLRRNVRRIRVLADGILRLERFRPDEVPLRPREVPAAELIDDLLGDHAAGAERKGLRLAARVDPSLRVSLDPDLLLDALGNLVENAVQYTHEGFVEVEAEGVDEEVVFRVRDSGAGIDAETRRGLFRGTRPGTPGGAGIGLRIAQHAANAQGGSIEVESERGEGSVFTLRLPRSVAAREGESCDPE